MKHFYKLLLSLIILFPICSKAQSNYEPGYVVTLSGDTLHGYIDYKEWDSNPQKISFKKDIGSNEKQEYSPKNAGAFEVTGFETYKQFAIWVSQDKLDVSELSKGIDSTKKRNTVFLRVLNSGKNVTLYAYNDDLKERFYIQEGNNEPYELILQ